MSFLVSGGPYLARTAEEITQSLIDYWVLKGTGVTDLSVGSVIRTEFEAVAQLAEQFYADQVTQLQDAIVQSAYSAFNFTPISSEPADGYLVFSVSEPGLSSPLVMSLGTLWQPYGMNLTFGTTQEFTIPAGVSSRFHVPASCIILGASGNLTGGATGSLLYPQPGIDVTSEDGVVNTGEYVLPSMTPVGAPETLPVGFINGQDPETPLEMRTRFTAFLSSLHRSTRDALEYGASTAKRTNPDGSILEAVAAARCIDVTLDPLSTILPVPPEGHAWVYIYNGIGSPGGLATTTALEQKALDALNGNTLNGQYQPGYRAAGIDTQVLAAGEYVVSLSISIKPIGYLTPLATSTPFLDTAVKDAVTSYFRSLKIGATFYLSSLIQYIVSVPGVLSADITAVSISPPSGPPITSIVDFTPALNGIVILGASQPAITVLS